MDNLAPTPLRPWSPSVSDPLSTFASSEHTTSGSLSSTISGLGAITGKALRALGRATLRGVELVIVNRHLITIARALPHTDEEASHLRNINSIYDDILEFSRPEMYKSEIRNKHLGYILGQIGMNETRYLISALSRWHAAEIHILLSEILIQTAPLWNPGLKPAFSTPLLNSYTRAQPWDRVSLVPLIHFFSKLIRTSCTMCQIVLDVGFLDVLLSMNHAYDFGRYKRRYNTPASSPHASPLGQLIIACNAALFDILAYFEYRESLSCHSIMKLWPCGRAPKTDSSRLPFTTRRRALLLGVEDNVMVDDDYSPYLAISLNSICCQPCISILPPQKLLRSLVSEVTNDQATRVYLARSTHKERVVLLTKLFKYMPISTIPPVNGPSAPNGPSQRCQLLFCLDLIRVIAQTIPGGRPALLDAGVIEYLIRVLQTETPGSYFAHIIALVDRTGIPRIIRDNGLPDLVRDRSVSSTPLQQAIQDAFSAHFPLSSNLNYHAGEFGSYVRTLY